MQELLIEKIRTDGDVQSRERISDDYVEELADLIKDGKKLPPIEVFNDGTDIWVSDGFHRIHAHLKANKRTIRCDVKKGGKREAAWASCAANQTHGLRRTNADKTHAVNMALNIDCSLSDEAIAQHVGVSRNFVFGLRKKATQPVIGLQVERTGVDGKKRKLPPPTGTPKPTKDAKPQEDKPKKIPPPPPNSAVEVPPAPKVAPPPPPPQPKVHLDEVGKSIPDHLWPLWDRGDEIAKMASIVTRISNQIREMHDEGDLVILDGNGQAIVAALETAKQALNANIPHAVCPYCKGTLSQHCRFCKGRGIVGEFQYKHVPSELKS